MIVLSDTIKMSLALHQIHSEEDDLPEEEMEEDVNPILEQCDPGTDLGLTELELPFPFKEEFVMVDKEDNSLEKKLIETKVAGSLQIITVSQK